MTVSISLWIWLPLLLIPTIWVWFTRSIPADHFDEWYQQWFKLFLIIAGVAFVLSTILGFITQHLSVH